MSTGLSFLILVALALGSHPFLDLTHAVAPSASAQADAAITIPIELQANRPLIRIRINQQGPFAMLVDPTAAGTVVDQGLVTELAKRPAPDRTVQLEMEFAAGHSASVIATVTDVSNIVPDLTVARPRGVIGASAWPDQLVSIEYARWRLSTAVGSLPETNRQDVYDFGPSSSAQGLVFSVAGQSVPCSITPLFPGGLLLPGTVTKLLPTVGRTQDVGIMMTPAGRALVREVQLAETARLGAFELQNPIIQFADAVNVCLIGGQRLREFAITFDSVNRRVRLTRERQP
jgi:hypothetical protein